jgi:hypothetical protein
LYGRGNAETPVRLGVSPAHHPISSNSH